jgi:hypothetical protein
MPSLPAFTAAALVLSVHLPVLAWAFRAVPQDPDELLCLNAVLLRHLSTAEITGDGLRLVSFAHLRDDTEQTYGGQLV